MRGAVERLEQAGRDRLIHAWQIARLVGFSKVPDLDKLLKATGPRKPTPKMTAEQIETFFDGFVK